MPDGHSLPRVFLIGAAKAGTTSLARWLSDQPGLYLPALKEPHYFTPPPRHVPMSRPAPPFVRTLREYRALYRNCPAGDRAIDASTSYLWSSEAAQNIRASVGEDVWIIAVLREPVERAWSNYLNDKREGIEDRSFADAIDDEMQRPVRHWGLDSTYLAASRYAESIRRYIDAFGRERVLVVYFEDLVSDARRLLPVIANFIGIDVCSEDVPALAHENAYSMPCNDLALRLLAAGWLRRMARVLTPASLRHAFRRLLITELTSRPILDPALEQQMTQHFQDDVQALSALIGSAPPWARFADVGKQTAIPHEMAREPTP